MVPVSLLELCEHSHVFNSYVSESQPLIPQCGTKLDLRVSLSSAILLKYMFLFLRLDSPTSNRTSFASNISVNRSAILKAPSWDALGAYARITKLMVLLLIITSTILELAWQVGILTNPQGFQRTLKASASLQMLLLVESFLTFCTDKALHPLMSLQFHGGRARRNINLARLYHLVTY